MLTPRELFNLYNAEAPYPVPETDYQHQMMRNSNTLGWVCLLNSFEAKSTIKFLKQCPNFKFESQGSFLKKDKDLFVWGINDGSNVEAVVDGKVFKIQRK